MVWTQCTTFLKQSENDDRDTVEGVCFIRHHAGVGTTVVSDACVGAAEVRDVLKVEKQNQR